MANLTDINEIDNALFDFADIDASSVFDTDIFQYLNVNGTGRTLIDFCKVHDLLLLNGRAYQDKLVGKLTCKNASTVSSMSFHRLTHYTFLQTLTLMIFVLCTQMCIVQLHLTCNTNSIGDEYHYLFQCNFFNNERKQFYLLSTVLEIPAPSLSV